MRCIPHQPTDESIAILAKLAKKYGVEAEVIYQDAVPPVADYHAAPFKLLEETMAKVYPGYDVCPYIMTGGTDARFYKEVTDNALRFAPLEINHQQHASIHAAAENLSVLALPPAVDFYKQLLESYCTLEEGRRPEAKKPAARRAAKKAAPVSEPEAPAAPEAAPEAPVTAPEAPAAPAQSAAAPAVSEAAPAEAPTEGEAAPARKLAAKKPAAKKPAARKPAARKPAAKKAAPKKAEEGSEAGEGGEAAPAKKPAAKKPAARKPAAKKAAPKAAAEAPAEPAPAEGTSPAEAPADKTSPGTPTSVDRSTGSRVFLF